MSEENKPLNQQIKEITTLIKQMVFLVNDLQNSHQKLRERLEVQNAQLKEMRERLETIERKNKAA